MVRVGDADRAAAMEQLSRATVKGYLGLWEFEERAAAVAVVQEDTELNALFADLPGRFRLDAVAEARAVAERVPIKREWNARDAWEEWARVVGWTVIVLVVAGGLVARVSPLLGLGLVFSALLGCIVYLVLWLVIGCGYRRDRSKSEKYEETG